MVLEECERAVYRDLWSAEGGGKLTVAAKLAVTQGVIYEPPRPGFTGCALAPSVERLRGGFFVNRLRCDITGKLAQITDAPPSYSAALSNSRSLI